MKTTNQIFKEYCSSCGCELEIHIDSKYNYKTYWCNGSCIDHFPKIKNKK